MSYPNASADYAPFRTLTIMPDVGAHDVDWDQIETRFSPPKELMGAIPRRAVRRDSSDEGWRARLGRGCLMGCLAPMLVLGLFLVLWAGLAALILPLGTETRGVVTERQKGTGSQSHYFLKFRFRPQGREYSGQWQVPTERWRRVQVGDTVRVRYFPFAPGLRPIIADGTSVWASILGLGPLGLLLVGIGSIPLLSMATRYDGKYLVKQGLVTPAVIVARNTKADNMSFVVRDENGGVVEVVVSLRGLDGDVVGDVETALYLPGKPEQARLYRHLDWKASS